MPNNARLVFVPLVLGLLACGGGGHSPSEPSPPPQSVPLTGSWAGTITVTSPPNLTCSVTMSIGDPPDYVGDWRVQCSDGSVGSNLAFAFILPFSQVVLGAIRHPAVFGGCGWAGTGTKDGRRFTGDWSTADNCTTGPLLRGRIDLTKQN